MNSKNSKTSYLHELLLNLNVKIDSRRSKKSVVLSNLSIYYKRKNIKSLYKNNKFEISVPAQNVKFELPNGTFLQQIFKIILNILLRSTKNLTIIHQQKYVLTELKTIPFKIKTRYYLGLFMSETMKLLGNIKSKINKHNR